MTQAGALVAQQIQQSGMTALSESTHYRRKRVQQLIDSLQSVGIVDFDEKIARLAAEYAPGTALTYARTWRVLQPEATTTKNWREKMEWLELRSNLMTESKPAIPLQTLLKAMQHVTAGVQKTLTLMYLTAARHGDLRVCKTVEVLERTATKTTYRMIWVRFKSDRLARRGFCKTFVLPTKIGDSLLKQPLCAPQQQINDEMRTLSDFRAHSVRKAATSVLEMKYTDDEITMLTGHAPETGNPRHKQSLRPYKAGGPSTINARLQIEMVSFLFESFYGYSF